MSEITSEYARVREAFDKPTIGLLGAKWAPVAIAVFRRVFSRESQFVPVDRLHIQVEEYVAELASTGAAVPDDDGRTLCRNWMNRQWLYRTAGADEEEEQYSLTSHALEALAVIDNLASDRALISESRLSMILDSVHRWALRATPDPQDRILRLDAQIAELTAERDRLAGGGEVVAASDEHMLDGYANLTDLLRQLPGDFKRVEESVEAMHRRIVEDFREDERPISAVLDEYLERTDRLMDSTPEGRAFEGAFQLLLDEDLLHALKDDLHTILDHPFATSLAAHEKATFRSAVAVIRSGVDDVLTRRSRLTATLRDHIVNHDVVKDRELDATLRRLSQRMAVWMKDAGPRSTVDISLIPEAIEVEHLRERFYDPDAESVPPPLVDGTGADVVTLTIDELRTHGGPLLPELRSALAEALLRDSESGGDHVTMQDLFDELPEALRRPVELYGLLHIGTGIGAMGRSSDTRIVEAVRPDGERVRLRLPTIPLNVEDARALLEHTNEA